MAGLRFHGKTQSNCHPLLPFRHSATNLSPSFWCILFITMSSLVLVQLTDDRPSWMYYQTSRKFFHCVLFMIVLCHLYSMQLLTHPSPTSPSNLMADVQKVSIVSRLHSRHLQILLKFFKKIVFNMLSDAETDLVRG